LIPGSLKLLSCFRTYVPFVYSTDLLRLIQNEGKEAEGKGDHEPNPTFRKKRDRF
jgi:hypothetical protein